jgi:hypothetical protein
MRANDYHTDTPFLFVPASSSGRFLNDIGALQYGEHAWAKTKFYSDKSYW